MLNFPLTSVPSDVYWLEDNNGNTYSLSSAFDGKIVALNTFDNGSYQHNYFYKAIGSTSYEYSLQGEYVEYEYGDFEDYRFDSTRGINYRHLDIAGGEDANNPELLEWLNVNAKRAMMIEAGTYVGHDPIDFDTSPYGEDVATININFTCNGTSYSTIDIDPSQLQTTWYDNKVNVIIFGTSWTEQKYRTITLPTFQYLPENEANWFYSAFDKVD